MDAKMMVFSKKTGEKIAVRCVKSNANGLGWCLSGWSKSGGWKAPVNK